MKVKYRPAAIDDIETVSEYLADELRNTPAAQKLRSSLLNSISLLKDNPLMGMTLESKLDSTNSKIRFLIVSKQIVFYEVNSEEKVIEIIRILDSRTDYLSILFGEYLME